MPTLILLSGNVASGKSTLAGQILKHYDDTVVVNDDAIWTMFGGGDYRRGYAALDGEELHLLLRPIVEYLLGHGKNVVLDLPAINEARREHFVFDFPGGTKCEHLLIEMDWGQPLDHAVRRWQVDSRGYTLNEWIDAARDIDHAHTQLSLKEQETWKTMTVTEFNEKVLIASQPLKWPTPPSVGESSPSSPISSSTSSSDPQHLDDNHPDAFGSPGEYASDEEWTAFQMRQAHAASNALGATDRGENGLYGGPDNDIRA